MTTAKTTMLRRVALCLTYVGALMASVPVDGQTLRDGRVWANVTAQDRANLAHPVRWYLEVQERWRDGVGDADQLLVRPAVGYDLTARSSVWLGYGYIATYRPSGGTLDEHRAWQQYLWTGPVGGATVMHRSRLEQRGIEGGGRLAWRLRQLARVSRPVVPGGRVSVLAWDELFVHLNDTRVTRRGFDQNRLFAGVAVTPDPRVRLEMGYLHQYVENRASANRSNHVASTTLVFSF